MSNERFQHVNPVKKERAGRAPYNFVPLPEKPFLVEKAVPDMDGYDEQLFTGWIDYRIQCLTDIYIRGMRPLQKEDPSAEPFLVQEKPIIPGSSLRGMFRTLLEVLSGAPLRQMNDEQLFMRAVASSRAAPINENLKGGYAEYRCSKHWDPHYEEYDGKVDFVQALFGRAARKGKDGAQLPGWQGRVFFEDASLEEPAEKGAYRDKAVRLKILSQPKPTTYQHYLTQSSDEITEVKDWDSKDATIRGFKFYWHRPSADYVCRNLEHREESKHHTYVQPVLKGTIFKGRIRFENLSPAELGGLLVALDLPEGCAHKIGMGKPLGLGSIRVKDIKVYRTVRQERYTWLFDSTGNLDTGVIPVENTQMLQDRFAERVNPEVKTVEELWQTERLHELHCMLKFDGLPNDWNHRTRYLFFGKINGENYNEYNQNNVPNGKGYEKRRVLPKPSNVLKGKVPNDRMPPFKGTCK